MQDTSVYLMAVERQLCKLSVLKHVFHFHLFASLEGNLHWASKECCYFILNIIMAAS